RISGQQAVALELFAGYLETVLLLLEDPEGVVISEIPPPGRGKPRAPGRWRDRPDVRRALAPYTRAPPPIAFDASRTNPTPRARHRRPGAVWRTAPRCPEDFPQRCWRSRTAG